MLQHSALLIVFLSRCAPMGNYQTYAIIVKGFTQWKQCMRGWWEKNKIERWLIGLREDEADGKKFRMKLR